MPTNCSTLIQRKQNILHKILRSNSEGKLQNAVAETTAELCVAGTRKTPGYSASINHLTAASNAGRSNLFPTNRIQPSSNHFHDAHLPSIRDENGNIERQNQMHDELRPRSRSKTPVMKTSSKSIDRPQSASFSSIFNTYAKRSTENFANAHGGFEDMTNPSAVPPPSRRSQRPNKGNEIDQNTTKQTIVPQKQSGDSGVDIRFSNSSGDTNQQQRVIGASARVRTYVPQVHVESPLMQDTIPKERTSPGQLYQRRPNNTVKAPIKQKIDKYRRRSEETTQAIHGGTLMITANSGLSATTSFLAPSTLARPKLLPSSPSGIQRVSSDGEIQARLEVLRLSMDTNLLHTDQQSHAQLHQYSRSRVKSPFVYNTHQKTIQTSPTSNSQIPAVRLRRTHGTTQPVSSANSSQYHYHNNINNRHPEQQHHSVKQSANTSPKNLYLAFVASRHLSTLEDPIFDCEIDHQKLIRIFTWLKGVEEHRHEQLDHEQLLIQQNQRMLDKDENLSLYSEIQNAVDDLPANTTGKPCEKIATMQFED